METQTATDRARRGTGARDGFLPLGALHTRAGAMVGLACLLAWAELLFCFEGVLRDEVELAGGLVHDPFFRAATLAAALALLGVVALGRLAPATRAQTALLLDGTVSTVFATTLGTLCSAGATLLTHLAPELPVLPSLTGVGAGLFVAWGILAWGRTLARLDLREALLLVSGACCLQWVPLVFLPPMGFLAKTLLIAGLGCCSGVLLVRTRAADDAGMSGVPGTAGAPGAAGAASEAGPGRLAAPTHPEGERRPLSKLAAMAATMFAFSLVIQFVWCFFIKMLPGRLDVHLFPGIFATVIVACVLVVAWAVLVMERQRGYRLELFYRMMALMSLCGVAATGVAASNESSAQLFAMYALVYVGYSLLGPTMWLLSMGYAHMRRTPVVTVLGCMFGLKYLGLFAGASIVDGMKALGLEAMGPTMMPTVVLACVAALAVAYLLVFPERELLSLSPLLFRMSSESIESRCRQIAAERGLTPRETEVFALLARGRDVGYICEELVIARNTANVHRKNIYAKLGIHSQQELLSVVEGAE